MSRQAVEGIGGPDVFRNRGSWAYGPRMDVGVLGPLVIVGPSGEIPITGVKERTVLAHLLARVGQVVPAEELVDALWPHDPPRTARRTLQSYVARLRTALEQGGAGGALITTEARGYRLPIDPAGIDAHRFVRLVELGRTASADGQHAEAAGTFASALALWRGPAYAGFEDTVFGRAEGRRLNELRLAAVEDWLAARIDAGAASAAVPELEAHTTANPLRERGWALLVRAHAASDNQAAALAALDRARRVLADELGVDPGEELRTLQARVLAQDPTLQARTELPASLVPPVTPMVGRTEEMAALEEQWRAAASGPGRRVLLTGEPGSGRWRLAGELAVRVHRQRAAVVLGGSPVPGRGSVLRVVDARGGATGALVDPRPGELQLIVAGPDAGVTADAEVRTQPLDVAQVGQLLGSYLPDGSAADVERAAVEIHARSGGNVARTRELSVQWARALVAGRVADRTAASVGAAAAHEQQRAALADDVLRWSALRPDPSVDQPGLPVAGVGQLPGGRCRLVRGSGAADRGAGRPGGRGTCPAAGRGVGVGEVVAAARGPARLAGRRRPAGQPGLGPGRAAARRAPDARAHAGGAGWRGVNRSGPGR